MRIKKPNVMLEDKIISIYNRTHVEERDINKKITYVSEKLGLEKIEAARKIVNWAIDKKIELVPFRKNRRGITINKMKNIEDLVACELQRV